MGIRFIVTLMLVALLATPGTATFDPARTFLMTAFNVSAADIGRLDGGGVVSGTLDAKNRREVATLGIARIKTSAFQVCRTHGGYHHVQAYRTTCCKLAHSALRRGWKTWRR